MSGIPFIDLKTQRERLREDIDAAIARVLDHGQYILGPEVGLFEEELAAYAGAGQVISCANGTDALTLVHLAEEVRPGDAVLAPSMTFVATVEPTLLCGATPVYVDIDPHSFNMSPAGLEEAHARAKKAGLRPRLIIPVDLYGLPADYGAIMDFAEAHGLVVVADAAQSMGAQRGGVRTGVMAHYTCTSFFPAKPLGCYGDGGAVITDDAEAAERLRSIRYHGKGRDKYDNVRVGLNSRLDTLQAAVLREKLRILDDEIEARERIAQRYTSLLNGAVEAPEIPNSTRSAWALYTIMTERRDAVQAVLKARGIPSAVYYPNPLHRQSAYGHGLVPDDGLPVTDGATRRILSLPMHPYLEEAVQDRIVDAVRTCIASPARASVMASRRRARKVHGHSR